VYARRDHRWHLGQIAALAAADPVLIQATEHRVVDLADEPGSADENQAIEWWEQLTSTGGEGMVVKPMDAVVRSSGSDRKLIQPGIKCRGADYLRIIYGPEYTRASNLDRLRHRGLGHKRSLALREFALGIEALDRFVARDPLYRVHECVFGVLALESEPVDPRL
jgi:protein phosphatase